MPLYGVQTSVWGLGKLELGSMKRLLQLWAETSTGTQYIHTISILACTIKETVRIRIHTYSNVPYHNIHITEVVFC